MFATEKKANKYVDKLKKKGVGAWSEWWCIGDYLTSINGEQIEAD